MFLSRSGYAMRDRVKLMVSGKDAVAVVSAEHDAVGEGVIVAVHPSAPASECFPCKQGRQAPE